MKPTEFLSLALKRIEENGGKVPEAFIEALDATEKSKPSIDGKQLNYIYKQKLINQVFKKAFNDNRKLHLSHEFAVSSRKSKQRIKQNC